MYRCKYTDMGRKRSPSRGAAQEAYWREQQREREKGSVHMERFFIPVGEDENPRHGLQVVERSLVDGDGPSPGTSSLGCSTGFPAVVHRNHPGAARVCVSTCMCMCVRVCVYKYVCACVCLYACVCAHTQMFASGVFPAVFVLFCPWGCF